MADTPPPITDDPQDEEEDIFADTKDVENPFGDVERMKEDKKEVQEEEDKPQDYLEPVLSLEPEKEPPVESPPEPEKQEEVDNISVESEEEVKSKPPELLVVASAPSEPTPQVCLPFISNYPTVQCFSRSLYIGPWLVVPSPRQD